MEYELCSVKGTRQVTGTLLEAIDSAIAMEAELQPAFGVTVESADGVLAEIHDGQVFGDDDES